MPFSLFCCKVRAIALRLMNASNSGIFLFVGFSSNYSILVEIYESSRYDWTDDQCREASDMLDVVALRVELNDSYADLLSESEVQDIVGKYCLN